MSFREELKANPTKLAMEKVHVPEWKKDVYVRVMGGDERDAWEQSITSSEGNVDMVGVRSRLTCICSADENGDRLFDDGDEEWLGREPSTILQRIFAKAQRVNKLTKSDIEELVGNSESGRPAAS